MLARSEAQKEVSKEVAAELIGRDPFWIGNALKRVTLSSGFDGVQGRTRLMTKTNLIELAFLAAFVSAGAKLMDAAAYAAMYVRQQRAGKVREWIFFSVGSGAQSATGTDELSADKLAQLASKSNPPGVVVIQAGEIVRRIDRFFEEGATN